MRAIKNEITARQNEQRNHVFFELLQVSTSREPLATMARSLAWWPMVFQDVLRLNAHRLQGTDFAHFAEHHLEEDAGHDRWFLDDLNAFDVRDLTLTSLFGSEFQPIRDACYALVSEVHREQSPAQRVAFLLALEGTGHVFFENVSEATARLCPDLNLRYLSHFHLGVEKDHDFFSDETEANTDAIEMTYDDEQAASAAIARVFETFDSLYTYLADRMGSAMRNSSYIRQLGPVEVEQSPRRANLA